MLFNTVQNQTAIGGINYEYSNSRQAQNNSDVSERQSEINSLNEDIATFTETKDGKNSELSMEQSQEDILQTNITNAQTLLDVANANVSSAQEALSVAQNIPGEEITDEDGNVTIDYSKRDAAVAQAQNQLEAALSEQEDAAKKLEEAQNEYNQLLETIADIDSQIAELDGQISANQTQIDQLENEINTILAEENQNDTQSEENGTEIEITPEEELDLASISQFNSLVADYTDRDDLSAEEYGQVFALSQIDNNFKSMYSQFTNQLDSEGWVDDVYNKLKDITDLGITREMIQEDFDNYSGAMKSLKALINKDEETAKETTDNEFIRQVNEASTFQDTMEVFERYYGNEQDVVDAFNKYIDKNQDKIDFYGQGMYNDVRLSKIDDNYILQIKFAEDDYIDKDDLTEDGYINFEMSNEDILLPIPIQGLLANGEIDIEKDKDILKKDIDFNSCYRFWTGVDYSQENIDKYNNTVSLYSQANMGIAQAYNVEQALKNTDLNNAMDIFTDLYEGDEDAAVEAFNDYYATLIQENNPDVHTNQGNNKLTQIKAQKNENGEIEYVMRYEDSNPDDGFSDLAIFSGYNGKDNYYEIKYNPNRMENDDSFIANSAFNEINKDIAKHNVIQERFNRNFEAQMGKSPQDAINEYFETYETAFGHSEVQDKLNSYIEDMDTYAQKLSAALSIGSIGLSFVCPAFGFVAMGSSFLDNGIDAVNMASNDVKGEDWQSLATNTMKEASFIMIGMGIGKLANSANTTLSAKLLKNTKLSYKTVSAIGIGTEVAVDGTLGAGFDLLTTGDLNLSGNGLSVMLDIVSGIRGYKAIASQNYVKGADGTYTSFSKDGYVEYIPNGDGTFNARTFDINDRTKQLGSQTTLLKNNTINLFGKNIPWFGSHFEGLSPLDLYRSAIDKANNFNDSNEYVIKQGDEYITLYAPSESTIKAGIKIGAIDTSFFGNINMRSFNDFITTYDKTFYEKLTFIQENYSDLDVASFKKLANAYKDVPEMLNYIEDINRWSQQIPELRQFAKEIEQEGINDGVKSKNNIAQAIGISPDELSERGKGFESIYDKLARKVLKGDNISTLDVAKTRIDDLIGTRFVLKDVSQENIDKLVENLCQSILDKKVIVTEIHNYSNQSQKYLSEENIEDIKRVCAKKGIEVKVLAEEQTSKSGYVSAQMNIRYLDGNQKGARGELQIRGSLMDEYGEIEHIPYDIRRGKNIGKNNRELEQLFDPVMSAVHKLKRNGLDEIYDNYILDCYKEIRSYELGGSQGEFKLPDFPEEIKEYNILSFDNLKEVHIKAKEIKNRYNIP